MGTSSSKDNLEFLKTRFAEIEQQEIRKLFCAITKCDKEKINVITFSEHDFLVYTDNLLSPWMAKQLYNIMCTVSLPKLKEVNFFGFAYFLSLALKGTFDEQGKIFSQMFTRPNDSTIKNLKLSLDEISSVLLTTISSCAKYQSWNFSVPEFLVSRLSKVFFYDLLSKEKQALNKWELTLDNYSLIDIEKWFSKESLLAKALCEIINSALPVTQVRYNKHDCYTKINAMESQVHRNNIEENYVNLPFSTGANWSRFKTLLDFPSLWKLNLALPLKLREMWQLLYSSQIHGESFSTLLGHVLKKGPTIIIIRDKDGYIFGGFASISWDYKPKFMGNEDCFVFQLYPELKVYESSGFNNNFMYLCLHQHTLPNGMGFGGQLNNFGLWIDAEFNHGHSILSCATYKSEKLSCQEQFHVDSIEVWRAGPPPEEDNEKLLKKSILDSDASAKAMLTMVNKIGASDGLREMGPEEEGGK